MKLNFWMKMAVSVLSPLFRLLTAPLKDELDGFIKSLYKKAEATENPLDDMVVKILADILGIEVE